MANTTDNSELARAREWLDMARAKWRLQTMQHRSRYNPKTGEYRQLPTRIRRFLNGTPVGMKSLVLELLKESAPYRSPVFDCETDDLVYRPTNTFIRKDGIEHTTNGKDPTYTIIQDLLLDDGREDSFGFADESSCAQAGETEYHWDEPSVADCPDGGQGVSYQITDISRDRDTDLFSYRVRRVQALTVHVPPHVEECDARRRVTVETWDNVYGEPGAYRWDAVRGGGEPIAPPNPCAQADGTTVKVDAARNPDCTYRVTVQTIEAKTDPLAQFSAYRDQYKTSFGERTANAFAPLPRTGTEYSGGVTIRYVSERNEDGTWNNSTETETERPVQMSTVEHRVTPRGTRTNRTDTNQASPADGITTDYGSWKYTKTPGGLYNNEYVEFVRAAAGRLGVTCADTAFLKTHETRAGADALPAANEHVPPAGGGLVTTWTYDVDDDGAITRRERTEREHPVTYAVRRRTWGWLGTTSGFTHRSVPWATAHELYNSNATGTSVEVRLTNGGMYDVEVQSFLRVDGRQLGFECDKTIYQHMHETVASASAVGAEASAAGNGHTYRRSYSVDAATGAITRRDRDTTELPVPESRRSVRVTARGTVVRTSSANAAAPVADASQNGAETDWEKTPGGRYNNTTTTTAPRTGPNGASCERDAFLHSDGETLLAAAAPASHVEGGSGGVYRERSSRLGDDGLWETTTATHSEREVTGEVHVAVTARAKRKTTITRQTTGQGTEPAATAADAGKELRRTKTRGGLWTLEETTSTPLSGEVSADCAEDLFLHRDSTGTMAAARAGGHVSGGTGGHYRERSQRLGDDGVWSVVSTDSAERTVMRQRVDERVTRHGKVERVTDMQTGSPGNPLGATASDVGKEHAFERTRGGLYNVTRATVTPLSGDLDEGCEKTAFLHTHSTTNLLPDKALTHADPAGNGVYVSETWSLTELGTWERRRVENTEEQPDLRIRQYKDAFGETKVTEEFSHASESGGQGGRQFTAEHLVQSVEAALTNGKRYNVRTQEETPTEVDSGWLHFEKATDKGLAVYYDFIVFRNATMTQVKGWIAYAQNLRYTGAEGSFSNHPGVSISPNKFRLWDGTVSITTTFTPKAWASGGSSKDDNWETEVDILSVNFVPASAGKLLKVVTKETHRRGGGVGKDRLESLLDGGVIKGSQFAFHPGGQAFSYDLITAVETKGVLVDMPRTGAETLWGGDGL